tara:strand:+ start:135 stop:320 length:186 start_codon:yes stop_codon:yes gene_type:complete
MTKRKKIKIGDKKFVVDGDSLMEEGAFKRYQKNLETAFKIGGKLHDARRPADPYKEHEQND